MEPKKYPFKKPNPNPNPNPNSNLTFKSKTETWISEFRKRRVKF
jgi:hypothetical protein